MMDTAIPYRAYQPKRHSRSSSSSALLSDPPSPSIRPSQSTNGEEKPEQPFENPRSNGVTSRPLSVISMSLQPGEPKEPSPEFTVTPSVAPAETQVEARKPVSPPSSPSWSLPASTSKITVLKPKSSTFKHVPLRTSSPLRPASAAVHTRTFSSASTTPLPESFPPAPSVPSTRISSPPFTSPTSTPASHGGAPSPLPPVPAINVSSPPPPLLSDNSQRILPSLPISPAPFSNGSSLTSPRSSPSPSSPIPQLPITSTVQTRPTVPAHRPAPYRPGFQPKGVYRPRTDEFILAREKRRESGKIEERRLQRRLEKLIDLHFSPRGLVMNKPTAARRSSSIFDFNLSEIKNAGDLWRGVLESRASSTGKVDIRAAEQAITPWQADSTVSQCPICATSFHPLTNRKHHCRMCGQIICSLPPQAPNRPQTCSILFVADTRSGKIEEIGETVDYGVRRRTSSFGTGDPAGRKVQQPEDMYLRGVRICRTCRAVVLKKQYAREAVSVPLFSRLYESLLLLEKEIEDSLPEFQELVLGLSHAESSHRRATSARKRLIDAFTEYDTLAKRIRTLPCVPGSSQDRVQTAVMVRANAFLQKNMFPLQSLPKKQPASTPGGSPQISAAIDMDAALAHRLQPLLEQEALLEGFVEEANAQRKFEDAKTLKNNLKEIRAEIERIIG